MLYEHLPVPISTAVSVKNLNIVIYYFEQVKSNKKSTDFFSFKTITTTLGKSLRLAKKLQFERK